MPSTTRGSILISTANDIGEALVEKLGGVGYSPNEWKEKYNLCGIAPVDSAPALSVLADSAGTGDERGSILIATADAIGAILNKKYNVLRGFKPKEWASACRKMKALEEGSVASASIASFSDGADTVPLTSCVCSIDANLDGKTAVVCSVVDGEEYLYGATVVQGGFNINNGNDYSSTTRLRTNNYIPITSGSYTIENNQSYEYVVYVYDETNAFIDAESIKTWQTYGTPFSISGNRHIRIGWRKSDNSTITADEISGYHCYKVGTKTTKTADLGRAVYGGSADIIKGEGVDNCTNRNLVGEGFTWSYNATELSYPYFTIVSNAPNKASNKNFVCDGYVNNGNYRSNLQDGEIGVFNNTTGINRFCVRDDSCTTLEQFLEKNANMKITYEVTNPTDFTFEPVKIDSFPGVNNIWNDSGDTAVEYYQAPTPYARKTATGGIANFSDQRTDLPLTKAIANIAPSIAGKSAVNLGHAGVNLLSMVNYDGGVYNPDVDRVLNLTISETQFTKNGNVYSVTTSATWKTFTVLFPIVAGVTYYEKWTLSIESGQQGSTRAYLDKDFKVLAKYNSNSSDPIITNGVMTPPTGAKYLAITWTNRSTAVQTLNITEPMIELGSSASAFEPYNGTTYTAELGETVYGGSVDFVSGEVQKTYEKYSITGQETGDFLAGTNNNGNRIGIRISGAQTPLYTGGASNIGENKACLASSTWTIGSWCIYTDNKLYFVVPNEYTNFSTALQYLVDNNATFVVPLATPTESAIPGRVISPIEGVNNYWNDAGGDTEIQYFENET